MATQSSIRKPKDTLEKPIPDSSIPYILILKRWQNRMREIVYNLTKKS